MKNKLVKMNMTSFDYKARKLGVIGLLIFVGVLTLGLPIVNTLNSENLALNHQIEKIQQDVVEDDKEHK